MIIFLLYSVAPAAEQALVALPAVVMKRSRCQILSHSSRGPSCPDVINTTNDRRHTLHHHQRQKININLSGRKFSFVSFIFIYLNRKTKRTHTKVDGFVTLYPRPNMRCPPPMLTPASPSRLEPVSPVVDNNDFVGTTIKLVLMSSVTQPGIY